MRYSLLILCWRSGQQSVIYDRACSSCTFNVLASVCSETLSWFPIYRKVVSRPVCDCQPAEGSGTSENEGLLHAGIQ